MRGRDGAMELNEPYYGRAVSTAEGDPELLFTENESDNRASVGSPNASPLCERRHRRAMWSTAIAAPSIPTAGTKARRITP